MSRSIRPGPTSALFFLISYLIGLVLVWGAHALGLPNFMIFSFAALFLMLLQLPRHAFSPLSIFFLYYGAWFIVAPAFAQRYEGVLALPEYTLATAMAFTVFGVGIVSIRFGQRFAEFIAKSDLRSFDFTDRTYYAFLAALYVSSTSAAV